MEKNMHSFSVESRKAIELSGVTDMGTYSDEEIEIDTLEGRLIISGSDLNVTKLDVSVGICHLTGKIDSLVYADESQNTNKGILHKIFKW